MTTKLNFGRDIQGYNAFAPQFSDYIVSATLAQSTDTSTTVPSDSNCYIAVFEPSAGATIYVAVNETAQVPAGASFSQTTSECNPAARQVYAGDVLHFITPDIGSSINVAFYSNSTG